MVGLTCRALLLFDFSKVGFLGTCSRHEKIYESLRYPSLNTNMLKHNKNHEWQKTRSQNKKRTCIWKKNILLSMKLWWFSWIFRSSQTTREAQRECPYLLWSWTPQCWRPSPETETNTVPDMNKHALLLGEKSWNASLYTYIPSNWVVRYINYIMLHHVIPHHIIFIYSLSYVLYHIASYCMCFWSLIWGWGSGSKNHFTIRSLEPWTLYGIPKP